MIRPRLICTSTGYRHHCCLLLCIVYLWSRHQYVTLPYRHYACIYLTHCLAAGEADSYALDEIQYFLEKDGSAAGRLKSPMYPMEWFHLSNLSVDHHRKRNTEVWDHRVRRHWKAWRDLTGSVAAHTISQRIRTLKKIPPELIPLGKCYMLTFGGRLYQ